MKFSHLTRIYDNNALSIGHLIKIEGDNFQYLTKVLRLKIGSNLRIFNEQDGEFLTEIIDVQKKSLYIKIQEQLRLPLINKAPTLTLAISLIKGHKMLEAINMATQLGVDIIIPIISARSQGNDINKDKVIKILIEATEQSERLCQPTLLPILRLEELVYLNKIIIYANEDEDPNIMIKNINGWDNHDVILLIGPEGGFSDEELKILSMYTHAHSISLGHNILRTETAVCAGLAQLQLIRK